MACIALQALADLAIVGAPTGGKRSGAWQFATIGLAVGRISIFEVVFEVKR